MKKAILITFILLMNVVLATGQTVVATETIDEITYTAYTDGTATITKGEAFGNVIIPEKVRIAGGKYKVTSIGSSAFRYCSSIEGITIPESITEIGEYAFYECDSLRIINIPSSVKKIGYCTFSGCSSLKEIIIPNSVTEIDINTFQDCSSLERIIIPNSVEKIGHCAFMGCGSLKEIIIPNSVTYIGPSAFQECDSLKKVIIPESVVDIGSHAFLYCGSLEDVTIPNSVENIDGEAFNFCNNIKKVIFASDLQRNKFAGIFPKTAALMVEENVLAQNNFTSPASPSIDLTQNSIQPAAIATKTIDKIKYTAYKYGTASVVKGEVLGNVTIPEKVEIEGREYKVASINGHAFMGCDSLKEVTVPNSVTKIGSSAFQDCCSLKKITIPKSVTLIGQYAFWGCESLEKIIIPNSVTMIGQSAFYACYSLKEVALSNSVTSIGIDTFSHCKSLEKITIPNSVTRIGSYAFSSCISLKDVILPNSVTSISTGAFGWCSSLERIYIPNSVTIIGEGAFYECGSLKEITIPNLITDVKGLTFSKCGSLEEIAIPNSVTKIGKEVFSECGALRKITLSTAITSIDEKAFYHCSSMESIVIPYTVTSIASNAFEGCENLKEVVFASDSQRTTFASVFPKTARLIVNFDPSAPPSIDFVANSLQFVDANGNNAIDAEEKCTIRLQVTNSGKGDARNCVAKITSATIPGVTYKNVDIPQIRAGETKTVEIPLTASLQTQNGTAVFTIQVNEPNGFGTDAVSLSVNTRAFDAPMLRVVDFATVSADGSSVLAKKSAFDLQILLQNVEVGKAENVQVSIEIPENVFLMDTQNQKTFTSIDGGDTKKITYSLIANNNYAGNSIPVKVNVKEKHGKYAESRTIDLPLNQTLKNHNIVLEEKSGGEQRKDIRIASIGSDVDKNIPSSTVRNDRTFAVIIANENYNKEANVPYAVNDGSVFSEYCSTTLGVPSNNIHLVRNATLNDIRHEVNWITNVMDASGGKAKVLFYYAGHGIPDERTRTAFLLPVDGYGSDVTTGYPLANLYSALGEAPAKSVTVFLDACFSGTKREGDMMASARGVAIKVNETSPVGNMVVFSASQGDETAYPYTEQGHGLFTYYLLKKLQDTEGNVTLGDLSDYVIEQVKLQSVVINSKPQTPSVIPSPNMSDSWRSETLK